MDDLMKLIGGVDEAHRPFEELFETDFGVLHPVYGYSGTNSGGYEVEDLFHEANRISMLQQSGCTSKGTDQESIYKYSLRIKSCGGGMADDGYKWRKYGQKSIKNSPNPRSYYRCTNPRCSAKKQVERSVDEADTYVVTYEGLHLHFTFPLFLHEHQTPTRTRTQAQAQAPPVKKQRGPTNQAQKIVTTKESSPLSGPIEDLDLDLDLEQELVCERGLLEDVVPLMVRKPVTDARVFSKTASYTASDESCTASPASSNSFSWSSTYSYLGLI